MQETFFCAFTPSKVITNPSGPTLMLFVGREDGKGRQRRVDDGKISVPQPPQTPMTVDMPPLFPVNQARDQQEYRQRESHHSSRKRNET